MSLSRRPSITQRVQSEASLQRVQSEASLQLLEAAQQGNETLVESLLSRRVDGLAPEESVDTNARGQGHMTPLHLATQGNYQNVVVRLLGSESIDVNVQDELGRTALIIAAQKGLTEMTRVLLHEERTNFLLHAQGGYTALHVAAWHGHIEVVNLLLDIREPPLDYGYGELAYPRSPGNSRKGSSTCRSNNSSYHRDSKFRIFKRSEPSSRRGGGSGSGSERKARRSSSSSSSYKSSVRSKDSREVGPAPDTKVPQVQLYKSDNVRLLKAKTSAEQFTALHLAAGNGHVEVVVSLIQAYGQAMGIAQVLASVREKGGKAALGLVMTAIMRITNSHGEGNSSEDVRTDVLDKALGTIFLQGYDISSFPWSSVDEMIFFVNERDCIGRTPLHHATWEQHLPVVEKLLEIFIVNVNAPDMDGFTPLHLGCRRGAEAIVQSIIAHDSKLQILNPNLAAKHNKATRARVIEVKRLQQKSGTIVVPKNLQDSVLAEERTGMTALHYAVERNNSATVAALAGRPDIDIFAVASPGSNLTVMETLMAPQDAEQDEQTPLTMAISAGNGDILHLLMKSGRRNEIMQAVQSFRNYSSKHDSGEREETQKIGKEYHRKLLRAAIGMMERDSGSFQSDMLPDLENELVVVLNTLLNKPLSNKLTLLHHAAFAGLSSELELLLTIPDVASNINTVDDDHQTPLHFAAMGEELGAVKVLIKDTALRPNEEDSHDRTALQIATEKRARDIISLLMGCPDVKLAVDTMYRDRVVNDNAANAILVVAALIASVTFSGWLQPPLGLRQYYNVQPRHGEPPGTIDSYAAVQQSGAVLLFWVFNSLSFFFAMGTVISGAAEVLPMRDAFIGQEVRMVRGGLMRTSIMLVLSIVFVLVAFSAAGFASLPPIDDYQKLMKYPTWVGGTACVWMLFIFWSRMMGSVMVSTPGERKVKWWRGQPDPVHSPIVIKVLWTFLKLCDLIPENYARFESRRQGAKDGCRRKLFWMIVKFFNLDREEYQRYSV